MTPHLLYILRHAHAENAAATDHARPLSAIGLAEAEALGAAWPADLPWPERIQVSDARRTQETAERLVQGAKRQVSPVATGELYNASAATLLASTRTTAEDVAGLMLVAHNPGIHQYALGLLAPMSLKVPALHALRHSYAPCTLTVLEWSGEWSRLTAAAARCVAYYTTAAGWWRA